MNVVQEPIDRELSGQHFRGQDRHIRVPGKWIAEGTGVPDQLIGRPG
jgi:hypothetical protein